MLEKHDSLLSICKQCFVRGLLPGPVRYFQASGDQTAEGSEVAATSLLQGNSVATTNSERPQQARLGYPLYTGNVGTRNIYLGTRRTKVSF